MTCDCGAACRCQKLEQQLARVLQLNQDLRVERNQLLNVPYPRHCSQPGVCAGKGSCPRDPVCID